MYSIVILRCYIFKVIIDPIIANRPNKQIRTAMIATNTNTNLTPDPHVLSSQPQLPPPNNNHNNTSPALSHPILFIITAIIILALTFLLLAYVFYMDNNLFISKNKFNCIVLSPMLSNNLNLSDPYISYQCLSWSYY